jgi:hypothetical protein
MRAGFHDLGQYSGYCETVAGGEVRIYGELPRIPRTGRTDWRIWELLPASGSRILMVATQGVGAEVARLLTAVP